jgi:hypothetical protein
MPRAATVAGMTMDNPRRRPDQRATDQDRDAAATVVQEAHGDGRLDVEELDERLTRIYSSKTQLELRGVTADLVATAHGSDASILRIRAKHSSQHRRGQWRVPPHIVATAEHSSVKLDFTEAGVRLAEVLVEAAAKHGSVVLVVPEGWSVDIDEVTTEHGTAQNKAVAPRPGGTRLRVTGLAKHGSIVVRHPRRRRWWWPWLSR